VPAIGIRRRLAVALLVIGAAAVASAVAGHAAPQADGPPGIAELTAQVEELSVEITALNRNVTQLSGQVTGLDTRIEQLDAKASGLDAKLSQVNSRTIDISQDIQLLKQLANSTHDRLVAVCRNVNHAWGAVEIHMNIQPLADVQNCWRNYYDPGFAATFSSRWTDPIP
jgi:septal ring factor EnvC (AmiA/AmiB activator)